MIFLFQKARILGFHVNLSGCKLGGLPFYPENSRLIEQIVGDRRGKAWKSYQDSRIPGYNSIKIYSKPQKTGIFGSWTYTITRMFFLHKIHVFDVQNWDHLLKSSLAIPNRQDTLYLWKASFWHDSFRSAGNETPRNWYVESHPTTPKPGGHSGGLQALGQFLSEDIFCCMRNFCKQPVIKDIIEAGK